MARKASSRAKSRSRRLKAAKRKISARGKSIRKKAARKRAKPGKTAKKAKRTTRKKGRSTAAGMRRALKMKQAAERTAPPRFDPTPRSPSPALSQHKPSPIPDNPHEQGNTANIEQNTTARGLSR